MDVSRAEIMTTLLERLGDAAIPLQKLNRKELYALEKALDGFELKTRTESNYRIVAKMVGSI